MTLEALIRTIKTSAQHRYLYHFTDEANFPSIARAGLISKARMRTEGWWPHTTGGNELSHNLDTACGIDGYVNLCFTRNHPMMFLAQRDGRLPNPRYLGIHPEALNIEGTMISFGVANAVESELIPIAEAIERLDIEVIYNRTNWSDPVIQQRLRTAEKFEILVPDCIPRNLIAGVF